MVSVSGISRYCFGPLKTHALDVMQQNPMHLVPLPLLWNLKSPTNLTYSYTGVSFGSMLPLTRWQQNSICASPEKQQFSPLFSSNSYGMLVHWKWNWWKPWYKITTFYKPRPEWQTQMYPFLPLRWHLAFLHPSSPPPIHYVFVCLFYLNLEFCSLSLRFTQPCCVSSYM